MTECCFIAIAIKLDKIYEVIVFRHWTIGSTNAIPKYTQMSPEYQSGDSFLITAQGGET